MKEYAQEMSGNTIYSLAGSGWYAITIEKNGIVYHRKSIIGDSVQTYYEFEYASDSASVEKYKTYINYIDEKFSG